MELLKTPSELSSRLEDLRKILLYRREELTTFQLSQVSLQILLFVRENPHPLNELFLEFLIKLSYALYIKSKLLLDLPFQEEEEDPASTLPEKKRIFALYQALPLERVLEEGVFLPRVNGFADVKKSEERGDLNLLLSALLRVLERTKGEPILQLDLAKRSLEEYIEDLKGYLYHQRLITWEDFLRKKGVLEKIDLIYYFLALLFLVFYGEAGIYQEENEEIQIFLKEPSSPLK